MPHSDVDCGITKWPRRTIGTVVLLQPESGQIRSKRTPARMLLKGTLKEQNYLSRMSRSPLYNTKAHLAARKRAKRQYMWRRRLELTGKN